MKERINADLPRSHESADLLHVSSPHDILEDDVIGKVHSPLCRCDRYNRSGGFLCLRAPCRTVVWGFAVRGHVSRCSLVRGCVMRRGVVCRTVLSWAVLCLAVLCRGVLCWSVLGCRGVRGRVLCWLVKWGGVVGRRVVCWRVLWGACVRWHRYIVVVLHPCSGFWGPAFPLCRQPRRRLERNPRECTDPTNSKYPLLLRLFPPSACAWYPWSSQSVYLLLLAKNKKTLLKSFASSNPLFFPFSLYAPFFLTDLNSELLLAQCCICCCTRALSNGASGRGPLYTLSGAILGA